MSEIVKGVLGGGLTLVAGSILPTALNLLLVGLLVLPNLSDHFLIDGVAPSGAGKAALLLVAAVVRDHKL